MQLRVGGLIVEYLFRCKVIQFHEIILCIFHFCTFYMHQFFFLFLVLCASGYVHTAVSENEMSHKHKDIYHMWPCMFSQCRKHLIQITPCLNSFPKWRKDRHSFGSHVARWSFVTSMIEVILIALIISLRRLSISLGIYRYVCGCACVVSEKQALLAACQDIFVRSE